MIVAGTGHRPSQLGGYSQQVRLALGGLATEYLSQTQPEKVISGMALGWDQALAGASIALGIPFIAAVPFKGAQAAWARADQERFHRLLEMAETVEFVCSEYAPQIRSFQIRNEWMVDRADRMAALWDGSWGGTHNCIAYARKRGVPIDNLWNRWTLPAEARALLSL
jgi:uncharacterized phage-like protein YoqJ